MDDSVIMLILFELACGAGTLLGMLLITWLCFTKAVKLFHSVLGRGSDGLPCVWWEYPFIPVFGYFIITLITALATVLIIQDCAESILEELRIAELINF